MVAREGTLDNLSLVSGLGDIAQAVLGNDKTYATITVHGTPKNQSYSIRGQMIWPYGDTSSFGASIRLVNAKASLQYCYGSYNSSDGTMSPSSNLQSTMYSSMGYSNEVFVCLTSNGTQTVITADKLKSSDESIVKVSASTRYSDMIVVESVGVGSATISYVDSDGKTYSFEVQVSLPSLAYYKTPTANVCNYIKNFTVTDNGPNVIYLVANGYTMDNLVLSNGLDDIADVELSSDKTYATITITGIPDSHSYTIQCDITNTYGNTYASGSSIQLINGKSSIQYDHIVWDDDGVPSAKGYPQSRMIVQSGCAYSVYTYFVSNGQKELITAGNLKSSDESIVRVFANEEHPNIVEVDVIGIGSAVISYEHSNGETYELPVTAMLPEVGFYTATTASASSYITEYVVSDAAVKEIYLVVEYGCKMSAATLYGEFNDIANITLSDDKTYATIEITGTPKDKMYAVEVNVKDGAYSRRQIVGIQLVNGNPYIGLCWPENNSIGHGPLMTTLDTAVGYATDVWIYYADINGETKLGINDLKSTNEDVIQIVDSGYSDGRVNLKTVGWGQVAVTYTVGGKIYSIDIISDVQNFGYYTAKIISQTNWTRSFTVTDTNDTFYFMTQNGITLDALYPTQALKDIATITLSADKTCVEIKVTGTTYDNMEYGFEFEFSDSNGEMGGGRNILDFIKSAISTPTPSPSPSPSVTPSPSPSATPSPTPTPTPEVEVEVDENIPTVDISTPVEDVTVGVDKEASSTVLEETVKEIISTIVNKPEEIQDKVSEEVVEAIKAAVESGAELQVTTSVHVENLNKDIVVNEETKEDIAAIENVIETGMESDGNVDIEGAKVAQLFDIKVTVTAKVDDVENVTGKVSVLDEPVVFTVAIPEEMKVVPEGYERQMYIIYVHNGVVKSIPATQNEDGTITFAAHEFSTYALVYKDVLKAEPTPTPSPEPTPEPTPAPEQEPETTPSEEAPVTTSTPAPAAPTVPATGDTAQGLWYMLLSILSAAMLVLFGKKRMQK